jgi:hypothetical protein
MQMVKLTHERKEIELRGNGSSFDKEWQFNQPKAVQPLKN